MKYEKGSFITVPNTDTIRGLPSQAQTLFMWMCFYANSDGECFPSRSRLAKDCGWTKKETVDKWIKVLETACLIEKSKRFKKNEQLSNIYAIILYPPAPAKGLPSPRKSATPQPPQTDTELNPSSLTQSTNTARVLISSLMDKKGNPIDVTVGSEYEADGWSPKQRIDLKRKIERSLGVGKSNRWTQLLCGSAWDFKKGFAHFQGYEYPDTILLDEVSKTLAKWYELGETRDTIRDMMTAFFKGKKAGAVTITPNSVFSSHTYNSWKQNKL